MRLSVAILLGDSLRTRDNNKYLDMRTDPPCGCAIGGAQLAMGRTEDFAFEKIWPWLNDISPDGCHWRSEVGCSSENGFEAVMDGTKTIEQLADWVRSIEPSCGVCNRFDCPCVKTADVPEVINAVPSPITVTD